MHRSELRLLAHPATADDAGGERVRCYALSAGIDVIANLAAPPSRTLTLALEIRAPLRRQYPGPRCADWPVLSREFDG